MKVNKDLSKHRHQVKIKTTDENITSRSGLLLFEELLYRIDASQILDDFLTLKKRKRGYKESEFIIPFALALLDGASCLDDIKRLREDSETLDVLQIHDVPHPTTMGDFLRRFTMGHIHQFQKALGEIGRRFHNMNSPKELGVDMDSIVVEKHGHQKGVDKAYNGKKGYHPQFAFRTDTKECLFTWLQRGSAYSARRALFMLRQTIKRLPRKTKIVRFRADRAWYQLGFFRECEKMEEKKALYYITADEYQSHRSIIEDLPETEWKPFRDEEEVAEFRCVMTDKTERRFVVKRTDEYRDESQQVMKFARYRYHIVVTNDETWTAEEVMDYALGRGAMENHLKELLYGFSMDQFPCDDFFANFAYLLIVVLAYNLSSWLKSYGLPEKHKSITMKTLRYRFLHVSGRLVRSARRVWLSLKSNYSYLDEFLATFARLEKLRFT